MNDATLESRIYQVYAELSPSEKRLANVMLEHQMDMPLYTASELAAKASVSKSTAARLIRVLGYRSYPEAKRAIRAEQFWGSPQSGLSDRPPEDGDTLRAETMIDTDIENIRQTFAALPEQRLSEAAERIVGATRVWIIGLRSGHGLASHAAHYLTLVRPDVHLIDVGSGSLSHDVGNMRQGDLLIVIAFRRRPKVLVPLLEAVRDLGGQTLLITDMSAGASARPADLTLRCRTQSPAPFNSFTAAVTLINHLAWQVHGLQGSAAADRYRHIDQLVRRLDNVSTPQTKDG
ncbi:MurR/RpiR family transcriptional regulator [Celeribacter sp.]|uniref:MurR/RpiR family transcriptional regulator n=1 Tax=Celeribacter sp. TaxID=1890673 RepID=UPI003A8DEDE4